MNKNIQTFIGCDAEYDNSKIVLFGAPFDSTTSFRPGTRFASKAIRGDSFAIETYSPYQDKDLEDISVYDGGDLELPFGSVSASLSQIEEFAAKIVSDGKIPFMIGGEHLVTLGSFKGVCSVYSDVHIIHFDAHADLRDDYLGEKLSHATVMRRCWEITGDNKVFQFGIRSGERSEFMWAKSHVTMQKFNFDSLQSVIKLLEGKKVYLSIDLDVLDPSVFPGTGTPEAGGVSFDNLLNACLSLKGLDIVGIDVNELCPVYDQSGASTATACKLIRELLLML